MKITIGKIASWIGGPILILLGLLALLGNFVFGSIAMLLGALVLPPVRRRIREQSEIEFSRWVVVLVFITGIGIASVGISNVPSNSMSPSNKMDATSLIQKSPSEMLPTVNRLGADWAGGGGDSVSNQTSFVNTQTESSVTFRVTVFEMTSTANSEISDRRESVGNEGFGTEDVSVGDGGFLYKPGEDIIFIQFRVQNVVAEVRYFGESVLTPESNAIDMAEMFVDTITD